MICGINQFEMAELANISPSTVQSIEVGRKPLSEEFAQQIGAVTGVDAGWLLSGDPKAPPLTPNGSKYTDAHFRDALAHEKIAQDPRMILSAKVEAEEFLKTLVPRMNTIFQTASVMNRWKLAEWKTKRFLEAMEKDFGCRKKRRRPVA
jgi:transcriptional regulator with XRE-family HTH domain